MKEDVTRSDGRDSRWKSHRARRRIELITAARDAVATHGCALSMEEIATACGTSKSVFYRYFKDKAGVQAAVGEFFVTRMRRRMVAAAADTGTFEATVHALVSEYLKSIEASGEVYRFVTTAPSEAGSPIEGFVESIIQLLMDHHVRHLGDQALPEPLRHTWAAATVGLVQGAGESWMDRSQEASAPQRQQLVDYITGWATHGLARSPAQDALDTPGTAPTPSELPEELS